MFTTQQTRYVVQSSDIRQLVLEGRARRRSRNLQRSTLVVACGLILMAMLAAAIWGSMVPAVFAFSFSGCLTWYAWRLKL